MTDLNHEGIGGVPALFKSFAQQAGLDYEVSLETHGGAGLDYHLENKREQIGRQGWDVVVAHGFSTLDADKPGDPAKLIATSKRMAELLRSQNSKVQLSRAQVKALQQVAFEQIEVAGSVKPSARTMTTGSAKLERCHR